ncbi:MAG TPA: protein-L-isoaspartate O-methyltransferase [Polyangiaceae bacterium]|jgi:protein-L-isoaspartate(D-aspartate) O-methyltransferase|nr:protein-L-isoaspartate O-methyltransferase [Polyangiaceae bacterium]
MLIPEAERTRLAQQLGAIRDERVKTAMLSVPRHLFVGQALRERAYDDSPLEIGRGQTISQPLMVATLLEAAELERSDRVLDVGAGSGYQAAVLSKLVLEVDAIEIEPELLELCRRNLDTAGIVNVRPRLANARTLTELDGRYQAVLVAAAASRVPEVFKRALAIGGRLVIPIGPPDLQILERWRRTAEGFECTQLGACRFVPLVG